MSLKEDVNRLERRKPADKRLQAPATPSAIRSKTGLSGSGGGIASPLTEVDADARTYYEVTAPAIPPHFITSTDGIFTFDYFPIETVTFKDGDGNDVAIVFDEPTPPVV